MPKETVVLLDGNDVGKSKGEIREDKKASKCMKESKEIDGAVEAEGLVENTIVDEQVRFDLVAKKLKKKESNQKCYQKNKDKIICVLYYYIRRQTIVRTIYSV